ncbi:MAG: Zn-ribbon domain-containing OB-fold protein [Acidimicrobiia bacterium]
MSTPTPGYVPDTDGLHAEFFRLAATTGRLHLQRCDACSTFRHPPRQLCPACFSTQWSFVPAAGCGHVHSSTVVHRLFGPAPRGEVPYAAVVVELDEGPRVIGTGCGVEPWGFRAGLRVRVDVEPAGAHFAHFAVVADGDRGRRDVISGG